MFANSRLLNSQPKNLRAATEEPVTLPKPPVRPEPEKPTTQPPVKPEPAPILPSPPEKAPTPLVDPAQVPLPDPHRRACPLGPKRD